MWKEQFEMENSAGLKAEWGEMCPILPCPILHAPSYTHSLLKTSQGGCYACFGPSENLGLLQYGEAP